MEFQFTLNYFDGLHLIPTGGLLNILKEYDCKASILRNNTWIECRGILSILMLGIKQGERIHMKLIGEQTAQAKEAIIDLLENC